jgi:hypothetical protein
LKPALDEYEAETITNHSTRAFRKGREGKKNWKTNERRGIKKINKLRKKYK